MKKYFGTDGIRFIYEEQILKIVEKLANSISVFKTNKIIIGTDTRYSKDTILQTLINHINNDIQISYVGEISTPGICYLSLKHKCLGLVITASHNDYRYNGIKVFNKGFKINDQEIELLESEMDKITSPSFYPKRLTSSLNLKEEYLKFLESFIKSSDFKIAFDVSNGALSSYAERIALLIGKNNHVINNTPDGYNINKNVGALYPECVQKYVKENNLDYGFCFDGDADRVILVDKDHVYTGDQLMYYLCSNLKIKKNTLIITPYSNKGLRDSLSKLKIQTHIVPPGDENILEYLLQNKLSLGGENAGHIIMPDIIPTGDGLLNAIILISLLSTNPIQTVLKEYREYPNKTVNIKIKNKDIINNTYINGYIHRCKETFKEELDFFIRLSGTENLLRIYICHKELTTLNALLNKLVTLIQVFDNNIITTSIDNLYIDEYSSFGNNVIINGSSYIKNSHIEDNVNIISSVIEDSFIGESSDVGPFTHIHKDSHIGKNNRVGNYTEVKNSITGDNTKAAHLSYLGDAIIGSNVNIGCGTIFVNYDGLNKTKTVVNDNVFIGCNSNLISPLIIGENAYIAAGSTITKNIDTNSFVIARSRETIKENKAIEYPYYKKIHEKR